MNLKSVKSTFKLIFIISGIIWLVVAATAMGVGYLTGNKNLQLTNKWNEVTPFCWLLISTFLIECVIGAIWLILHTKLLKKEVQQSLPTNVSPQAPIEQVVGLQDNEVVGKQVNFKLLQETKPQPVVLPTPPVAVSPKQPPQPIKKRTYHKKSTTKKVTKTTKPVKKPKTIMVDGKEMIVEKTVEKKVTTKLIDPKTGEQVGATKVKVKKDASKSKKIVAHSTLKKAKKQTNKIETKVEETPVAEKIVQPVASKPQEPKPSPISEEVKKETPIKQPPTNDDEQIDFDDNVIQDDDENSSES